MANNDPIKEYNSLSLKLDRLQEKMEMYVGGDEPVTDLHDCSNDLSDRGSRIEEYEHARFAEKKREELEKRYNSYGNSYSKSYKAKKTNTSSTNLNGSAAIVVFIIICLIKFFGVIATVISEGIQILFEDNSLMEDSYYTYDNYDNYDDYDDYNTKYNIDDSDIKYFESYKENISIKNLTTQENETYIRIDNSNNKSVEDLKIESIFYDENGNVLAKTDTYVNILIDKNTHIIKVLDAPSKYARCVHDIVNEYGKYSDISGDKTVLNLSYSTEETRPTSIILTNYNSEELNYVEVTTAYIKGNEILKLEEYNFFNLENGAQQDKSIRFNEYMGKETELVITVNDLYVY